MSLRRRKLWASQGRKAAAQPDHGREEHKNAPPPPAPLDFVRPACGSGSAPARPPSTLSILLGERVQQRASTSSRVPTSEATRAQAERLGIKLTTLDETPELDLTIDGADEIAPGSDPDQGRRRRAAAREDRRGGFGQDARDRRQSKSSRCWAVFRCRSKSRRSAPPRPAAPSKPPPRRPAARVRRRCAPAKMAMLSSRMAGTGFSTPSLQRIADPQSAGGAALRDPRRHGAWLVHRPRLDCYCRRSGRGSPDRADLS